MNPINIPFKILESCPLVTWNEQIRILPAK